LPVEVRSSEGLGVIADRRPEGLHGMTRNWWLALRPSSRPWQLAFKQRTETRPRRQALAEDSAVLLVNLER
jgi:hypothetical protein